MRKPSPRLAATVVAVAVCVVSAAACTPTAKLLDAGAAPATNCVAPSCTPDPGSQPADCTGAEAGLEFFPTPIINFDLASSSTATATGFVAQYMYSYVDGTSTVHYDGAAAGAASNYQPATVAASHCGSDPNNTRNNHVLHITGGPFLGWGGGIGVGLMHLNQDSNLCTGTPRPDYCPPDKGDAVSIAALDMSKWEGVAVWARRGPDSQPLLRVLVGNKDTDDDISYLMDRGDPLGKQPRFCQRTRECGCQYKNLDCNKFDAGVGVKAGGGYYCGAPGAAPGPAIMAPVSSDMATATNTCNTTRCDDPYSAFPADGPDIKFAGRPCTPYAFRNGLTANYCYDPVGNANPDAGPARPADPPPAQSDQTCGDHWTFPLHLTTDWQLYLVPFNTMFQQGFAKRSPFFDLASVSVARLTWDAGYIDYWVDDMKFYRHKK